MAQHTAATNPAAPHARLPKALLPQWKAFANPAKEMSDEVTAPPSSVIEDVQPLNKDKYGSQLPEMLSPNRKLAKN